VQLNMRALPLQCALCTHTAAATIAITIAIAIAAGAAIAGLEKGRCGKIEWMLPKKHTDLN
jgi:hypothetical protein